MVDFEVLERKIRENGLTIAALERAANIGNGVIRAWEKQNSPNVISLQKVARVLKCSVDELLKKEAV